MTNLRLKALSKDDGLGIELAADPQWHVQRRDVREMAAAFVVPSIIGSATDAPVKRDALASVVKAALECGRAHDLRQRYPYRFDLVL